jgi:hypothetical protein
MIRRIWSARVVRRARERIAFVVAPLHAGAVRELEAQYKQGARMNSRAFGALGTSGSCGRAGRRKQGRRRRPTRRNATQRNATQRNARGDELPLLVSRRLRHSTRLRPDLYEWIGQWHLWPRPPGWLAWPLRRSGRVCTRGRVLELHQNCRVLAAAQEPRCRRRSVPSRSAFAPGC